MVAPGNVTVRLAFAVLVQSMPPDVRLAVPLTLCVSVPDAAPVNVPAYSHLAPRMFLMPRTMFALALPGGDEIEMLPVCQASVMTPVQLVTVNEVTVALELVDALPVMFARSQWPGPSIDVVSKLPVPDEVLYGTGEIVADAELASRAVEATAIRATNMPRLKSFMSPPRLFMTCFTAVTYMLGITPVARH